MIVKQQPSDKYILKCDFCGKNESLWDEETKSYYLPCISEIEEMGWRIGPFANSPSEGISAIYVYHHICPDCILKI